jgi:hypothetical protein
LKTESLTKAEMFKELDKLNLKPATKITIQNYLLAEGKFKLTDLTHQQATHLRKEI